MVTDMKKVSEQNSDHRWIKYFFIYADQVRTPKQTFDPNIAHWTKKRHIVDTNISVLLTEGIGRAL
ncbi:MAG: hypothetical protein BYD32DRAFT_410025, partial [Podila humilis]